MSEIAVNAWIENITIPTYPAPLGDPNPLFLERRNNQGASGRIYPNPVTDYVNNDHKIDQTYQAIFIENEFIQLIILPQLGGRIFGALDKTNNYDFFYRQHVIKPALIGLFGSWISGGAEFNFPLHHRPSTFMPADFSIEKGSDGSSTIWLSDHEPTQRMKGMIGICLYPGKAIVETKARFFNRTPVPQSFLFWENIAVSVNDDYQVFFPPDVTHVVFHSKHEMAHFPVAREVYCGFDYRQGVDVSWHRNSPKATSYFAGESNFDFFGGYDHGRQAGVIHIANHHISPGKKLFLWGNDDFSRVWENNLTDQDGPYAELMAGSYTDNQPDFSWLRPYEYKSFSQYWYPFQGIGTAKLANCQVAVNLTVDEHVAKIGIYATEKYENARITFETTGKILLEQSANLAPGNPYQIETKILSGLQETDLTLRICNADGKVLLVYRPVARIEKPLPVPANPPPPPHAIDTVEGLYLTGQHVEQYLHPLLDPEDYWREALRRDPNDSRSNNAMGRLLFRRADFENSEKFLRESIKALTILNGHPYDGEPFYILGQTLRFQERFEEAYAAFYKAIWSYAWQSAGYYALAELDSRSGDFATALDHADLACSDRNNQKAFNLKAAILRRLGRHVEAISESHYVIQKDPLDFWALNENLLALQQSGQDGQAVVLQGEIWERFRADPQLYLDVSFDYANASLWEEAAGLLESLLRRQAGIESPHPMVLYALGFIYFQSGQDNLGRGRLMYQRAANAPSELCFPMRLEEWEVLTHVRGVFPEDSKAAYYLGNLLYDKKQYEPAIQNWQDACRLDPNFSIPFRNLGIAYYNNRNNPVEAKKYYERALELNPNDHRLFYEYGLLLKKLGSPSVEVLAFLETRLDLVNERDSLVLDRATLYNELKQPQKALEILQSRRFYPWEGLEGLIADQYALAHWQLGKQALQAKMLEIALEHFEAGWHFPNNLGAGRWCAVSDVPCQYYAGVALASLDQKDAAQKAFQSVIDADDSSWSQGYLPSLPYFQALAMKKLGREAEATTKLEAMLANAQKTLENREFPDQPNVQPFRLDSQKYKFIQQNYLIGLALLGLDRTGEAQKAFQEVLALDPYNPVIQ